LLRDGGLVFLFQEQYIVSFELDVLYYNTIIALEPGIAGKNGFVYRAGFRVVGFDTALFAVLLSFFCFFPFFFRRILAGWFLVGLYLWLSLFAFKTIDLISQLPDMIFKLPVFLSKGFDEVEQFAYHLKSVIKVPDVLISRPFNIGLPPEQEMERMPKDIVR